MPLITFASLLFLAAFLMFVVAPVIVRFKTFFRRYAELYEMDFESLPAEVQTTFELNGEKLFRLDFEPRGCFHQFDHSPNMTSYYSLWVNEAAGDSAVIAHVSVKNKSADLKKTMVEFSTEFADGSSLCTNNSDDVSAFKYPAEKTVLKLPNNQNLALIYRVHLKKLEKMANQSEKLVPRAGMEVFELTTSIEKEFRSQLDCGMMFLDERENGYRPTWKGAFLMTWKMLPPAKNIIQLTMRKKTDALLREINSPQPLIGQY